MKQEKKYLWSEEEIKRMLEIKEAISLDRIELKGNSILGFKDVEIPGEK